jgi:Tfp pilus assembly pilus retraction ATPase PilT
VEKIIKAAVDRGASDLHIKAGDVFRARIDGKLVAMTKQALTPDQTRAIALRLINNEKVRDRIDSLLDYDCSWGAPGIGRFRVNILRQRSSFMIVMRVIRSACRRSTSSRSLLCWRRSQAANGGWCWSRASQVPASPPRSPE